MDISCDVRFWVDLHATETLLVLFFEGAIGLWGFFPTIWYLLLSVKGIGIFFLPETHQLSKHKLCVCYLTTFNITIGRRLVFIHCKINVIEIIKPPSLWVVCW